MFAEERQNDIVSLVNKNGSVRVKDLSENLYDNSVATYMAEDGLTKSSIIDGSKNTYMMLESREFKMNSLFLIYQQKLLLVLKLHDRC